MNYFSDNKVFKTLRRWFGITKPDALQWGEWREWEETTKREHPIGYWMTEDLPGYLDDVDRWLLGPFRDVRYYWRNRFFRKTHIISTGLKPGDYFDLDTRILHGLMTALVDFVEVEKAWLWKIWHKEDVVLVRGRSSEAGIAYLKWEMTLDNPELPDHERSDQQAANARDIYAIYNWWKNERPARPDVDDITGYTEFYSSMEFDEMMDERIPRNEERETRRREIFKKMAEIEREWFDEDTKMLTRMIELRASLWT